MSRAQGRLPVVLWTRRGAPARAPPEAGGCAPGAADAADAGGKLAGHEPAQPLSCKFQWGNAFCSKESYEILAEKARFSKKQRIPVGKLTAFKKLI